MPYRELPEEYPLYRNLKKCPWLVDPYLESLREEPAFRRLAADLEQTYTALKIQRL